MFADKLNKGSPMALAADLPLPAHKSSRRPSGLAVPLGIAAALCLCAAALPDVPWPSRILALLAAATAGIKKVFSHHGVF